MEIQFDRGRHWRAKLGYVVLAMEQTVEADVFNLRPEGVGVHITRVHMPNAVTVANLLATADELPDAAARLLPQGDLDVVTYACTSASLVIGEERVQDLLRQGAPSAQASTLVTGVIRALRAFDARRLVVATPYLDEVNRQEADYFTQRGFEILDIAGFNLRDDSDMVRVAPSSIRNFARSLDRPEAEAIFISCGALRSLDIVEELEQTVGKPVVCSNQAMIWDCLRLAGIDDEIQGFGELFRKH